MNNFDKNYPNLQAVLDGTVSGKPTEWGMVRFELSVLVKRFDVMVDQLFDVAIELAELKGEPSPYDGT